MQYILGKPATAHARSDTFAKLEFYRRRVMGGCLRGGGAYKLLCEQKRRKKRHESKKGQAEKRENEIDHRGNFSIQVIQGHSVSRGKKETYNSVGRIPLGI